MQIFRYDVDISPVPGARATHRGSANVVFREFLCIERVLIVLIAVAGVSWYGEQMWQLHNGKLWTDN